MCVLAYAATVHSYLPLEAGATLRCFLSDSLHCDPMRITKKFAGAHSIGKQVTLSEI
jgi:hypothetical protein